MLILALLLILQDPFSPQAEGDRPPGFYHFGIGPDLGFWSTRFSGSMRVDGESLSGSTIDLCRDLNLSPSKGIPIYGGGTIYIPTSITDRESTEILFSAEYWNAVWAGSTVLADNETLGDHVFTKGTFVESHFHLTQVDLAVGLRKQDAHARLRGGVSLLLHVVEGKLRMEGAGVDTDEHTGSLTWGIGGFGEFRPVDFLLAGASVKGYTDVSSSSSSLDSWGADLRVYTGTEWKFLRVEAGFRYAPSASGDGSDSLRTSLYGPYASLSLVLRF